MPAWKTRLTCLRLVKTNTPVELGLKVLVQRTGFLAMFANPARFRSAIADALSGTGGSPHDRLEGVGNRMDVVLVFPWDAQEFAH